MERHISRALVIRHAKCAAFDRGLRYLLLMNTLFLSPAVVCCPAKVSANSSLSSLSLPRIPKSVVCVREFIVYANICSTQKWTLFAKVYLREYIYPYSIQICCACLKCYLYNFSTNAYVVTIRW